VGELDVDRRGWRRGLSYVCVSVRALLEQLSAKRQRRVIASRAKRYTYRLYGIGRLRMRLHSNEAKGALVRYY